MSGLKAIFSAVAFGCFIYGIVHTADQSFNWQLSAQGKALVAAVICGGFAAIFLKES